MLPLAKLSGKTPRTKKLNWLVVSSHLKNISQNGNLPQIGVKNRGKFLVQHLQVGVPYMVPLQTCH